MGQSIDRAQIQRWLERYGDEAERLARAAEAAETAETMEVGAEQWVDALWLCAHYDGGGDRVIARGQQLLARLWSMRGDGGLWEQLGGEKSALDIALALCAWGQRAADEQCIEEARNLFWQSWRKRQDTSSQCVELSFWVALLELGSALLINEREREMHIVVSRVVATLLNDYYDVEAKSFYRALDFSAPAGTEIAPARLALKAVDALMCEAVRCGDGRLFDWSDAVARGLAARGDSGDGAGEMLRLVGLRSLRHRAASWGIAWIERELHASDSTFEARSRCLCLRELRAATDEPVSGALRF